jgi:histidine triad (HIT) family protein
MENIRKSLLAGSCNGIIMERQKRSVCMEDCVFCRIIRRELPADVVYEDEQVLAFKDINPQAPTHVLVVAKKHLASLDDLPAETDEKLAAGIFSGIQKTAARLGVSGGYKVVTNCGEAAGQVVGHLHFHILAGKKFVP